MRRVASVRNDCFGGRNVHSDDGKPSDGPRERVPSATAGTDRNLLFGIIALQVNFITRESLVAGFDAWTHDKSRTIAEILEDMGDLSPEDREILDRLVGKFLEKHANDADRSLAALSSIAEVRADLQRLNDPDVDASLRHIGQDGLSDPRLESTLLHVSGTSLGRFRILRPHAKGGLGQVSIALDQELNREVALKEIQPQHADDAAARERFIVEAEITGGLEHPGIVPVYALGQGPDGRPFYAMRFVKGDSLKQAIRKSITSLTTRIERTQAHGNSHCGNCWDGSSTCAMQWTMRTVAACYTET